jgi:hypothetical protein
MPSSALSGRPVRSPRRRVAASVLVASLVMGVAALPAGARAPGDEAAVAAGWLARQFVDGERLETTFDGNAFPDQGLTIDAVLGFAAAGAADDAAGAATSWLARSENTSMYIGDPAFGEAYAGPTAKLALLAQVRGLDPTSFGEDGVDLIARLESLEQPNGRFADQTSFGDFSNSIGQSLAVIVLARQPGTDPSAASIDLLLESRCADGGFALDLEPGPSDCLSGADTTAFAAQALLAAGRTSEAEAALDHLAATQDASGGFAAPDGGPNANSTGVAAQALRAGGRDQQADAAEAFLLDLQQGCDAPEAAQGGIAFDAGDFDGTTAVRATAQALLGFAPAGLEALSAEGANAAAPAPACPVTGGPGPVPPGEEPPPGTAPPAAPVAAVPTFTG